MFTYYWLNREKKKCALYKQIGDEAILISHSQLRTRKQSRTTLDMESANAYIITPPSSVAELSPPLTPKQQAESEAYISDADLPPALNPDTDRRLNSLSPLNVRLISKTGPVDADIEDNYVQRTLANAKPKPPITWSTLLGEVSIYLLTFAQLTI